MAIYLVSYNTDDLETNYLGLHSALKTYQSIRLLKSSWLVETSDSPDTVFDHLTQFLEKGSHLLVIEVTKEYQGELEKKACDWMKKKLDPEPEVVEEKKGWFRSLLFG